MSQRAAIAAFVRQWLAMPDSPLPWLHYEAPWLWALANEQRAVPLYLGWTALVAIREDGSALHYDTEWGTGWSPASALLRRMALRHAAGSCPALVHALPDRPEDAVTCTFCNGTGEVRAPFLCKCAGYGWLIWGEETEMGIG